MIIILIIIIIFIIYKNYKKSKFWINQNVDFGEKNDGIIKNDNYKIIKPPKNMIWTYSVNINELTNFINNNYLENTYYTEDYIKKITTKSNIICLKLNNQIIGTIVGRPIILKIKNRIVNCNYIDLFTLNKNYRKTGISNLIMLKLKNYYIKKSNDIFVFKKEHSKLPFNNIYTLKNYYLKLSDININNHDKLSTDITKYKKENLYKSDFYQIFNDFNFYFKNDKTNITLINNNNFCNISIIYSIHNNKKYLTAEIGYFIGDYNFFINIINYLQNNNFKYLTIMDFNLDNKILNLLTFNTNVYIYMHNYSTSINSLFFNHF